MVPYYLILVVITAQIFTFTESNDCGPPGAVNIRQFMNCDPDINTIDLTPSINRLQDDRSSINILFDLPFDIDKELQLYFVFDKWTDDAWEKNYYEKQLLLCNFMQTQIPTVWGHLREQIVPPIADECFIPKGSYNLTNFEEHAENIEMQQICYGHFMVSFTLIKDEEEIVCVSADVDSPEPEVPPPPGK